MRTDLLASCTCDSCVWNTIRPFRFVQLKNGPVVNRAAVFTLFPTAVYVCKETGIHSHDLNGFNMSFCSENKLTVALCVLIFYI